MPKVSSFFAAVFTMKIRTFFAFGAVSFLGISISALVIGSYVDTARIFSETQIASADLSMPAAVISPDFLTAQPPVSAEKIIYVSLKDQTLVYTEGPKIIGEFKISSGLSGTPTPPGQYSVLKKKPLVNYRGAAYDFENTKWNLMFKTGRPGDPLNYYIHGAFWHHNFGKPMSHGCVNVSYADMEGLYNWADEGTNIVIISDSLNSLPVFNVNFYPTPPGEVVANKVAETSMLLSWNAATDSSGTVGYEIYQNNFLIATTTATEYEAINLTPKTLYGFTVYAYNQAGGRSFQPEELTIATLKKITGLNIMITPGPSATSTTTPTFTPGIMPTSTPAIIPSSSAANIR